MKGLSKVTQLDMGTDRKIPLYLTPSAGLFDRQGIVRVAELLLLKAAGYHSGSHMTQNEGTFAREQCLSPGALWQVWDEAYPLSDQVTAHFVKSLTARTLLLGPHDLSNICPLEPVSPGLTILLPTGEQVASQDDMHLCCIPDHASPGPFSLAGHAGLLVCLQVPWAEAQIAALG